MAEEKIKEIKGSQKQQWELLSSTHQLTSSYEDAITLWKEKDQEMYKMLLKYKGHSLKRIEARSKNIGVARILSLDIEYDNGQRDSLRQFHLNWLPFLSVGAVVALALYLARRYSLHS